MTKTALPSTGLSGVEKRAENRACTNNMAESNSTTSVKENNLQGTTEQNNPVINTITGFILNLNASNH